MDERKKNVTKTVTNIIMYLLFAVLVLGLIAGVMSILNSVEGLYVVYGEETITTDNCSNGITVEWDTEASEVTFTIGNTEDWGAYTVQDCTVKVVPKVSDENDFEFEADGELGLYSSESDLTAAFVSDYKNYDGNGLSISEDGEFSLYLIPYTSDYLTTAMTTILSRVYGGGEITIDEEIDLLQNVYFAIQVTSPSGGTVITVPFKLYFDSSVLIRNVNYNLSYIDSDSDNPDTVELWQSYTLSFTSQDGYTVPLEISVTGVSSYDWDPGSTDGTLKLNTVTGDVTITIVGDAEYTYVLSGEWLLADEVSNFDYDYFGNLTNYVCNFTCYGTSYTRIIFGWGLNCYQIAYGGSSSKVVRTQTGGWQDQAYRVIDFGDGISVSELFYDFMNTFAAPYDGYYAVTFDCDVDLSILRVGTYYDEEVSFVVSDIICFLSADDSITLKIQVADSDAYMITYVNVENALFQSGSSTYSSAHVFASYVEIEIVNPTGDVTLKVIYADAD